MKLLTVYKKGIKAGRKEAKEEPMQYLGMLYSYYIGSYAPLENAVLRHGEIEGYNEYIIRNQHLMIGIIKEEMEG